MTTALKLTQQTIHTIAEATGMTPAAVNDVYEGFNLRDQEGFVVLDFVCCHEDHPQVPLAVDGENFHRDFMFVTTPSETEFTEVITI